MSARVLVEGQPIVLGPDDFVAAGGQGRVYARDAVAFKLFDDPKDVPPPAKLAELRALAGPHVAAPDREVTDASGVRVGYTMPFFRGAASWAQLCTPAYRRRASLDGSVALGLVRSLGAALTEIHANGTLVVDLSENNVLVRGTEVCLIDLDSWQTPTHPATAVTPTIVSPHVHAGQFSHATDWFAFAVLVSTLLTGIHPFKGKHPTIKGLQARMRAGISVFDPRVRIPVVCTDPHTLPVALRQWLRAVLERGETSPAPLGPLPSPKPRPTSPHHGQDYGDAIRWVLVESGRILVATRTAAFVDTSCWHDDERPLRALGRTVEGHPFVLQEAPEGELELRVRGSETRERLPFVPDDVLGQEGGVFLRKRGRLLQLDVRCLGSRAVLLTREVARVLPHATQLFPGVALQNVLGTWRASLLGHPLGAPQVQLREWSTGEVLDARRVGDRLVVLVQDQGVISRHTYALSPVGAIQQHTVEWDVDPWGTGFVLCQGLYVEVGPGGVWRGTREAMEHCAPLRGDLRGMHLHTDGQRVFASVGQTLHRVRFPSTQAHPIGFDATRCR